MILTNMETNGDVIKMDSLNAIDEREIEDMEDVIDWEQGCDEEEGDREE